MSRRVRAAAPRAEVGPDGFMLEWVMENRSCPDCPAVRIGLLGEMLPQAHHPCAFRVATVTERATIPHAWFGRYGLGLVRRGIVVRQRIDAAGRATAVDVVGPGSALLLDGKNEGDVSGYAAAEAMVCLCPVERLEEATCSSLPTVRDMMQLHAAALERMDRLADARNRPTAKARLAALLVALGEVLAPPRKLDVIPVQLQRRDLAALLALRHESVSRALAQLERSGAIKRTRDGIELCDREALQA
jgi:CRP-like cAMP-binding protein